jgi:hypothetical protein
MRDVDRECAYGGGGGGGRNVAGWVNTNAPVVIVMVLVSATVEASVAVN